jgi:hypothetical protein
MATNTTNYGWTKPDYEDDADIAVLNETFDAIDAQVKTIESSLNSKQTALSAAQLAAVNSGIASTDVAQIETNKNNISSLADLVPKVASGTYSLNDLTWTTSVDGIIYSAATTVNGITIIYSAIITGFGRLRATDVIVPILSNDGTQIRFMANTNSWVTDAYVTLRIVGI